MRTIKVYTTLFILCVFNFTLSAQGNGFYLGAGLGVGDVSVDTISFPGSELLSSDSDNVIATEFSAGYEFKSNNFGIDLTAGLYDTAEFIFATEQADINSFRLGVSYRVPSTTKFNLFGRTGINVWQLDIEESGFFNPGPEAQEKQSSQDIFFQIGAEYSFTHRFRVGLAYDRTQTDFGHFDGFKLNMKVFF